MWRTVPYICMVTRLVSKLEDQGVEAVSARPSVSKVTKMFHRLYVYLHMLHHLLWCADHAEVGTASDLTFVGSHSLKAMFAAGYSTAEKAKQFKLDARVGACRLGCIFRKQLLLLLHELPRV